MERVEVVGQLGCGQARLRRHHAAADVDAHRRRQECILGRDDAADRCPQAEVRVRHQTDGSGEDRQPRGAQGLLEGVVVQLAGPRGQVRVYLLRHRVRSPFLGTVTTK